MKSTRRPRSWVRWWPSSHGPCPCCLACNLLFTSTIMLFLSFLACPELSTAYSDHEPEIWAPTTNGMLQAIWLPSHAQHSDLSYTGPSGCGCNTYARTYSQCTWAPKNKDSDAVADDDSSSQTPECRKSLPFSSSTSFDSGR